MAGRKVPGVAQPALGTALSSMPACPRRAASPYSGDWSRGPAVKRRWPEYLLAALFLTGALIVEMGIPRGATIEVRAALILVGFLAAFGVWVGVTWLASRR